MPRKPNSGRTVVYTAITAGYDELRPPPAHWRGVVDFVAFMETPRPTEGWEIRPIHRGFTDPCRNAKIHKIVPHRYFPDQEYSLWVDGTIEVTAPGSPQALIDHYLARHDFAVFRHQQRHCIYREARVCIVIRKDSPKIIRQQMRKYLAEGYPAGNGLAECPVLLRRHTPRVAQFNEAWYAEIEAHSRRDHLSYNYVAWKTGFTPGHFDGTMRDNPYFRRTSSHPTPRQLARGQNREQGASKQSLP
jgi:hypothetical protein